jgi:uncharacterized membrane protein
VAHALSISIAAWPIFYLARRVLESEKAGFLWTIVYLTNPILLNAAAFDFTPITLAVPFVAIGFWAVETRKVILLGISSLFLLACKEHMGLMVVGFGFLWGIQNNQWKTAAAFILLGATHSIVILGAVMPALSHTTSHIMFSKGLDQLTRYGWLGNSLQEAIRTIIHHPFHVTSTVMIEMGGMKYLALLLAFFLGFPLAALAWLFPGFGDLTVNLLSSNPLPRSILAYHNVILVPVLAVAAIYGVKRISTAPKWVNRYSVMQLSAVAVSAAMIGGYFLAPVPLPGARNIFAPIRFLSQPDPIVSSIRSLVGDGASVSAQANIGAHFSQRKALYRYPNKIGETDAIILRLESPTKNIDSKILRDKADRKYILNMLDGCLQMDRKEYVDSVQRLLNHNLYGIRMWKDPWLVLTRNFTSDDSEARQGIERKLSRLQQVWGISGNSPVSGDGTFE